MPHKIVTPDKIDLKVMKDHANVVLRCVNDVQSMANLFHVDIQGLPLCVWLMKSFLNVATIWGEVLFLNEDLDDCLSSGRVCIRTNETNVIKENVSLNIVKKMYHVKVNKFVIWIPSFNKIEEYELMMKKVQKMGMGIKLKLKAKKGFNLEDVTLVVNDKSKLDEVTTISEHVADELVVPLIKRQ
ncbi:hypothetical protein L1987_79149 [Smallanthus sonchifolius]|uniref:Uncharacterized protein n=1 Tax=Smallanthus sonchifolius TaxID=185202 RepID=A0ACB8ZEL9_9ASTR|nr:hypothetical protein L1987_79149 [Smallanthus sonchifolius]